ncbi:MAG: hypothetical protein ABIB43_01725 [archaeon]
MDSEELKKLLEDPKRILNIVRVFHQVLHAYDKMEEEKAKPTAGIQQTQIKDELEIICKDKEGNIKSQFKS